MQEKDFVAYEYKTVLVKAREQARATDMYEAFGWEVTNASVTAAGNVTISLRRDRKQPHRQELVKLERQAEEECAAIDSLERSKTLGARVFACIFGCAAALVLGGGMCLTMLVEGSAAAMAGGIILGLAGIALCAVNYPVYKKLVERKTGEVLPLIDGSEEKLAGILERGNGLLSADII